MRIAVVKPDWRISGGFEAVVGQAEVLLRQAGHDVERRTIDVPSLSREPYGLLVEDTDWEQAPEWFGHVAMTEAFAAMDVSDYDLVISTQPPSYAVRHPHQLALFYHHLRAFYDLCEPWVRAGFSAPEVHGPATSLLHEIDARSWPGVSHFLAGSPRIVERLTDLSGIAPERIGTYLAPPPVTAQDLSSVRPRTSGHVLCVGRHEFSKRVELLVAAAALLPEHDVVITGTGGRLPFAQALSAALQRRSVDPASLSDEDLWLNRGVAKPAPGPGLPRLRFAGRVDDEELLGLYAGASCLVAPAFDEDYGLTVLEAMRAAVPVIVCRDGGGLLTFVEDGVTGVVAAPTPSGLADAVRTLYADPDRARQIGLAGQERAAAVTSATAAASLLEGVERAMAEAP